MVTFVTDTSSASARKQARKQGKWRCTHFGNWTDESTAGKQMDFRGSKGGSGPYNQTGWQIWQQHDHPTPRLHCLAPRYVYGGLHIKSRTN